MSYSSGDVSGNGGTSPGKTRPSNGFVGAVRPDLDIAHRGPGIVFGVGPVISVPIPRAVERLWPEGPHGAVESGRDAVMGADQVHVADPVDGWLGLKVPHSAAQHPEHPRLDLFGDEVHTGQEVGGGGCGLDVCRRLTRRGSGRLGLGGRRC